MAAATKFTLACAAGHFIRAIEYIFAMQVRGPPAYRGAASPLASITLFPYPSA